MRKFLSRHRRLFGGLAILVIVVAAVLVYRGVFASLHPQTVRYVTQPVQRETLIASITGTGNMVLGTTYNVKAAVSGTVEQVEVKVGDHVTKGQVLFMLSDDQVNAALNNALTSYNQARVSVQNARVNELQAEQQLLQVRQQLGQQNTTTTAARTTLAPPLTTTITTVPTTLAPTPTTSTSTTARWGVGQGSGGADDTTTSLPAGGNTGDAGSFEVALLSSTDGASTTSTAQANTTPATVTELDVEVAEARLRAARLSLTVAHNQESLALQNYEQAQDDLDKLTGEAPADGVVTAVNIQVGDTVTAGTTATGAATGGGATAAGSSSASSNASTTGGSSSTAVVISNLRSVNAVVALNEVDIPLVKSGAKVTLTFDAIDDLTLTGKVQYVDTEGTINAGVVTYDVTIVPDTSDDRVQPGMTVSASIITNVRQDVLTVPNTAIKTQADGTQYVQVLVNGAPQQRTVQTGLANDTSTEILSGLNEGDAVITQTISPNASTTTTRSSGGLSIPGLGGGGEPQPGGFGR